MTEKQLRKLTRAELLELLIEQTRKNAELEKAFEECKAKLESREIKIENSGSIAEAALQLNGLFEAAQKSADQYLENIKKQEDEVALKCRRMEEATKKICLEKIQQAEAESNIYWEEISVKLEKFYEAHPGLEEALRERKELRERRKKQDEK